MRILEAGTHQGWVEEYRFHPVRRWRLDFAHPESKVGVEIQGGIWTRGRHSRGAGQVADMEKANQLMYMGWALFQIPASASESAMRDECAAINAFIEERLRA